MRVHGIPPARFLATCAAVILLGTSAFASGTYTAHHPSSVAQETASPSPTPTGDMSDQNGASTTPAPTSTSAGGSVGPNGQPTNAPGTGGTIGTPIPMVSPAPPIPGSVPAPPAGTTIDLKQGGISGNSNGPNWLDKFNRAPGPDTSGAATVAPAMKPSAPMKCKNMKTKKMMPCKK